MMRLSIDEYAKQFEVPIATVHAKLRKKELNYSIEDGIVYILVSSEPDNSKKTSVGTIIALYQKENEQLKEKVQQLEQKIDKLIDDKEQMLREERSRIEKLYQSKDEQLKSVLELINTKLQLSQPVPLTTAAEAERETAMHEEIPVSPEDPVSTPVNPHKIALRRYLKNIGLDTEEKRIIKRRFAGAYGSDIRILQHNGEFYLDLAKFDYSDLLKIH